MSVKVKADNWSELLAWKVLGSAILLTVPYNDINAPAIFHLQLLSNRIIYPEFGSIRAILCDTIVVNHLTASPLQFKYCIVS
jgi:hypothetical protein